MPRRHHTKWSEDWRTNADWIDGIRATLERGGLRGVAGSDFDTWDLEVRRGLLGGVRLTCLVEQHGEARQLVRVRVAPRPTHGLGIATVLPIGLAVGAWTASAGGAVAVLVGLAATPWIVYLLSTWTAARTVSGILDSEWSGAE